MMMTFVVVVVVAVVVDVGVGGGVAGGASGGAGGSNAIGPRQSCPYGCSNQRCGIRCIHTHAARHNLSRETV